LVEVNGLRKAYGPNVAVKDVTFTVSRGACFGLLGPNGAGKTTTISMIAGTLDPDSGSVQIDGAPVRVSNLASKRLIGYVPQDLAVYEDLSARDNLRFFGMLYNLAGAGLDKAIDSALDVAGLTSRQREPVRQFSGGMKRRLNIAAALLHDPQFLILDEPTVGVDPQSRNQIFETLEALLSTGKTMLYTTHYMEEVERLCTSVAIMDNGRIIANDDIHTLIHSLRCDCRVVIQTTEEIALDSLIEPNLDPKQTGRKISVKLSDIGSQLPPILEKIRSVARIEQVQTETPTLEEVFLHLTGRTLRD
jgi:ABC-2 type transport system ATP-binding protein